MKCQWSCIWGLLAVATAASALSVARTSFAAPPPIETPASAQASNPSNIHSLEGSAEKRTVMCFWLSYGRQRYLCGDDSLDEVKKKCNRVASAEVGEPVECSCTDDPEYIRDSCG